MGEVYHRDPLLDELMRLNQRIKNNESNPNWTQEMLNILMTARNDLARLCGQ